MQRAAIHSGFFSINPLKQHMLVSFEKQRKQVESPVNANEVGHIYFISSDGFVYNNRQDCIAYEAEMRRK